MSVSGSPKSDQPAVAAPANLLRNMWQLAKTIQARLRFVVVLAGVGGLIAYWDVLDAYYQKWTRVVGELEAPASDIEYFCPMHPYIIRDTPKDKCPICHMDLARRRVGLAKAEPLAAGTVSRVQLSPYRVVLAGVLTTPVQYQTLFKVVTTYGSVEFDETKQAHIAARQKGRIEKLFVNFTGQVVAEGDPLALLDVRYSPELTVTLEDLIRARQAGNREREDSARKRLRLWDISEQQIQTFLNTGTVDPKLTITAPLSGHVIKKFQREGNYVEEGTPLYDIADLDKVWIEAQVYEADQAFLKIGQPVTATTLSLPDQTFTGTVSFIYPHLDENTRTLRVRFEMPNRGHQLRPGMYATLRIKVAPDQIDVLVKSAGEDIRALAQLHAGRVLAVPENAVIDTGNLKVVYRETAPNTYEGAGVRLGPRLEAEGQSVAYYPILSALRADDRVVTNGSFLIDAETRLNPAAGSIYSGGGSKASTSNVAVRPSTPEDQDVKERQQRAELEKLPSPDRMLAEAQKTCPVAGKPLGSMGTPVKLVLRGQPVFLCCDGCEGQAKEQEERTLNKLKDIRAKAKPATAKP